MRRVRDKSQKQAAMTQIRAVEEILRRWDPIGVMPGEAAPSDEYDGYAPHIVTLVTQGCSRTELTMHLEQLRMVTMGLQKDHNRDTLFAKDIIKTLRFSSLRIL